MRHIPHQPHITITIIHIIPIILQRSMGTPIMEKEREAKAGRAKAKVANRANQNPPSLEREERDQNPAVTEPILPVSRR